MYWRQVAVAATAALATGWVTATHGWTLSQAVGWGLAAYLAVRWLLAWLGRTRYWHQRGLHGIDSQSCPSCGQYIYRQGGDWILQCKRCGWTAGLPGVRWLWHSVPAIQLRRTISIWSVLIFVVSVGLVLGVIGGGALSSFATTGPIQLSNGSAPQAPTETVTRTVAENGVATVTDSISPTPAPSDASTPRDSTEAVTNTPTEESVVGVTDTPRPTPVSSGKSTPTPQRAHPWPDPTVNVAVRNQAAPDRNFTAAVAAALEYWRPRMDEFGAYTVDFDLRPNASSPDLIVWYNHSINCSDEPAVGCAPRLNETYSADPPEHVQIEYRESANIRQTRNTLIHEFGHVLGIGHCNEPRWAMGHSDYCTGVAWAAPNVSEQAYAWRDYNLTYYVSYANVTAVERTTDQVGHAIRYFETGAAGTVPDNVTLSPVDERWRADIIIRFVESCPDGDGGACPSNWGSDFDSDGEDEFHTKTLIRVSEPDVDARGWYIGWALATSLTPDELPDVFVDPTYELSFAR